MAVLAWTPRRSPGTFAEGDSSTDVSKNSTSELSSIRSVVPLGCCSRDIS